MSANYQILSQRQDMVINAQGTGFQDVWQVAYKVTAGPSKGTVATITVPEEDHNAKYVNDAIASKVAELDKIASLGG